MEQSANLKVSDAWPVPPHIQEALRGIPNQGTSSDAPKQPKIKFVNPNMGNYDRNIRYASWLKLPMIKKDKHKGQRIIVSGSGPSLNDPKVLKAMRKELEIPGTKLMACKAAIKALTEKGFKVDYGCSMDPGAHIACDEKISKVSGVEHLIASSSDPALFDYLKHENVTIFHSATGYQKEVFLYKKLFKDDWIACGGYNVINRAVSCALYMGFDTIILVGADCGWRDSQDFYVSGPNMKAGVDMKDNGMVDGVNWNTRPDMLASGLALAKLAKNMGKEKFLIFGDVIPAKLRHKSDDFLKQVGSFVENN